MYFALAQRRVIQLETCLGCLAICTTYLARAFLAGWYIHGNLHFRLWKDQFDLKLPEVDHPHLDFATVGQAAE